MTGGLPLDGVDFYAELTFNNDRDWWLANKPRWEASVRAPLERLVAALADEFGPAKLYRPYRDVRFAADKTPYKTHQGALAPFRPSMGWYVQLGPDGLLTGGGCYRPDPAQLARYRAAVDDERAGRRLETVVAALEAAGAGLRGEELKTAPRGFTAAHPRIELLRRKNVVAFVEHGTPDWLDTPEVVERVRADWLAYRPLLDWLAEHVGAPEPA